ncbi:MAG: TIGR03086 family metal-binding protein [Acidimicrobiia bacterium]
MDPFAALAAGHQEFERRLRAVAPGDWDRPTPCSDWAVRDLVVHVIYGARMTVELLGGCTRDEAMAVVAGATLPEDPVAAYVEGADREREAFAAPGVLERIVAHPAGDFPGAVVLNFRIGDATMHAWDLARAIGADETLNGDLVAHVWEGIQPMVPIMASTGRFGEGQSGTVGEGAALQTRLLDATGRRP